MLAILASFHAPPAYYSGPAPNPTGVKYLEFRTQLFDHVYHVIYFSGIEPALEHVRPISISPAVLFMQ